MNRSSILSIVVLTLVLTATGPVSALSVAATTGIDNTTLAPSSDDATDETDLTADDGSDDHYRETSIRDDADEADDETTVRDDETDSLEDDTETTDVLEDELTDHDDTDEVDTLEDDSETGASDEVLEDEATETGDATDDEADEIEDEPTAAGDEIEDETDALEDQTDTLEDEEPTAAGDEIENETDALETDAGDVTDETADEIEDEADEIEAVATEIEDEATETGDEIENETDALEDDIDVRGPINDSDRERSADAVLADSDVLENRSAIERITGTGPFGGIDHRPTEADKGDAPAQQTNEANDGNQDATSDSNQNATSADSQNATTGADGTGDSGSNPARDAGTGVAVGAGVAGLAVLARRLGTMGATAPGSVAGSSGLLSTILAVVRQWTWRIGALLGYQRFSDDDPLEHESRAALYEQIQSSPGSYLAEISTEADVPAETARYHLRILEFENLVSQTTIRGRRRYFPPETPSAELDAALNDEATAAVLEALAEDGPDSVSGLAETLDRDPSTVTHHLDRLAEDGLVERERDGRAVLNRLASDVEAAFEDDSVDASGPDTATPRPTGAD